MKNNIIPNKAFTHGGKFHADDVFSAALLTYINPQIEIERGFVVPQNYDGIVFDIGFGEFDHHQFDSRIRENEIPYASFGLLWERFGADIMGEQEAEHFDRSFVQPIDLCDNTGCDNPIAKVIAIFNPAWDDTKSSDDAFVEAKDFALTILKKRFEYSESLKRAEEVVRNALDKAKNQILILPVFAPWRNVVLGTDIQYVVYPSDRGGYNAQTVPIEEEEGDSIRLFPEHWRGLDSKSLREITEIDTLSFCHNSGFLIAADTLEDILKACEMAKEFDYV